jgi:phytol kinase
VRELASAWAPLLLPDVRTGLAAGVTGLACGVAFAFLAARLRRGGVRVPYTRKTFHLGIFSGAALAHSLWGLPGTNVYGAVVASLVLAAVVRGEGNPFYEALARETDRPHRTLFIVVPLVTTAVGGLASAVLTGPYAAVGYLVGGWGDAVGEPVGARWGRRRYRVPSLVGVPAQRSLEGSAAVLLVGWAAAGVALAPLTASLAVAAGVGLACALAGALAEAASNHGLDNLTVQLAASLTAWALLGS